jgi:hypothetical protein
LPSWGDFTLLEELGRGGFGIVHRAWDKDLRRDVALKLIDARRLGGTAGDRLLHEGQLLARVRHRSVVTVFSAKRIGDQVGLAMELIQGRTLSSIVAEQGPMSAQEAALVGTSLCDALAAVHQVGLVHRDLKTSNVMRESGGRIVLMDFGAGREQAEQVVGAQELVGTPGYMAPEVLMGSEATPPSDIYSLGVLLFYLVTRRHPVSGKGFDEVRRAHRRGQKLSLAECRSELPARFVAVVERALSKDPAARQRSPQQFKQELTDAMPGLLADEATDRTTGWGDVVQPRWTTRDVLRLAAWGGVALVGVLILCYGLGFVTTRHLNWTFGRLDRFGGESHLSLLRLGLKTLFPPALWISVMLLAWNVLVLAVRVIGAVFPAVRNRVTDARGAFRSWLQRGQLDDPTTLAQAVCGCGFAAFLVHAWVFRDLHSSIVVQVDTGDVANLAALARSNIGPHFFFGVGLSLMILVLGTGLLAIRRAAGRARQPLPTAPVAGIVVLIAIALFAVAAPWRLLWNVTDRELPSVSFAGQTCFVTGKDDEGFLLNCPESAPPRNRTVRKEDLPRDQPETVKDLFEAYAQQLSR